MSSTQFDHVTVIKKTNVYFGGACISHTVQFEDGTKKTLGVILIRSNIEVTVDLFLFIFSTSRSAVYVAFNLVIFSFET